MTGIEYECLQAVGSNCGISDMTAAIRLIDVADRSGMDAMSMGVTISYAMESYETGFVEERGFHFRAGLPKASS